MANMPWFRMYAEFSTDPKVQFMSEALQRRYVFALCVTCNGEMEKVTDEELAYAMRITPEEWSDTKKVFMDRGLFTPDGKVKNWEKRQFKSDVTDPTNSERQQRYRERKRNGNVTEEKRPDTESDTDKDRSAKPKIPYQDILDAYNKFCPSLPRAHEVNSVRYQLIKSAYEKYANHADGPLRVFDTVFKKAERSSFLKGLIPTRDGKPFRAKFDWLFDPDKMAKVIEGDYDDVAAVPTPTSKTRDEEMAYLKREGLI